jgi:ABC-type multidrug transport system ATPase subunit
LAAAGEGEMGEPGKWSYSIRLNRTEMDPHGAHEDVETTAKGTAVTPGWKHSIIDTTSQDIYTGKMGQHSDGGFMTLQLLMDRYIIGTRAPDPEPMEPCTKTVLVPGVGHVEGVDCSLSTPEGVAMMANTFFDYRAVGRLPLIPNLLNRPNPAFENVAQQLWEPLKYAPQAVNIMPMPVTGKVYDIFWAVAAMLIPWCFILIFKYSEYLAISTFIQEKETRIREGLRMMGVTNSALIISWYATYAWITLLLSIALSAVLKGLLMQLTSFMLLVIFFWLFCMSYIAFGFMVHTFFDSAMSGGIVGMILSFGMFIVKIAVITPDTSYQTQTLLSFMAPTAFAQGIALISEAEKAQHELNFGNMSQRVDNYTFSTALSMLFIDIILYTLAGWYLDEVLPKQFGIQQPWYFPFQKDYWMGTGKINAKEAEAERLASLAAPEDEEQPDIEEVALELKRQEQDGTCVQLKKLRKVFSTPDGPKIAVHCLELSIYRGQIFVLLGHNGAGKTTTMTMLTGLYMPTSGDATVYGLSVRTQMAEIRQRIGVCPQHDVLFAELTVTEHLEIFAGLKGLVGDEAVQEVASKIAEVGLTEKALVRSSNLSGGQKRKLSLAIALLGSSDAVFLDEPTSGMDPYSRRSTWNILQNNRDGRVIILTTHFMDEADILGDRIGIMAEGRLKTVGSSLFLKNRYGVGYHLTVAKTTGCDDDALEATIQRYVPSAQVLSNVGTEISFQLPHSMVSSFPQMFEDMERNKHQLGIEQYSVSLTTLEEVFMKIADGAPDDEEAAGDEAEAQCADFARKLRERRDAAAGKSQAVGALGSINASGDGFTVPSNGDQLTASLLAGSGDSDEHSSARSAQMRICCRQFRAMYLKRAQYARRDCGSVCCMILMPCVLVFIGLLLLKIAARAQDLPSLALDLSSYPNHHDDCDNGMSDCDRKLWTDVTVPYHAAQHKSNQFGPSSDFSSYLASDSASGGVQVKLKSLDLDLSASTGFVYGARYCAGKFIKPGYQCPFKIPVPCCLPNMSLPNKDVSSCSRTCSSTANCCGLSNSTKPPPPSPDSDPSVYIVDPSVDVVMSQKLLAESQGTDLDDVAWGAIAIHDTSCGEVQCQTAKSNPNSGDIALYSYTIFQNASSIHASPIYANLANGAIKRHAVANNWTAFVRSQLHPKHDESWDESWSNGPAHTDSSISTSSHPLPQTSAYHAYIQSSQAFPITFFTQVAFAFVPGAIVIFVIRERERHHNSKHQQIISGGNIVSYWTGNYAFDMSMYMLTLAVTLLLFKGFHLDAFTEHGAAMPIFVLFFGFGLCITSWTYCLSFLFDSHTRGQVLTVVLSLMPFGMILTILSYVLNLVSASAANINTHLLPLYRFFPLFCLPEALYTITIQTSFSPFCHGGEVVISYYSTEMCSVTCGGGQAPGGGGQQPANNQMPCGIGKDLIALYCLAPVYLAIAILIDVFKSYPEVYRRCMPDPVVTDKPFEEDDDVAAEGERVDAGRAQSDVIVMRGLRKVYGPVSKAKVAVKGISLGIPRGECFGYLGINGAGKTSTLAMLTGDVLPSGGSAFLNGLDILKEQDSVRRLIGYCPQHDALLDRLTVREHLELFGRIKNVPEAELNTFVVRFGACAIDCDGCCSCS